MKDLSRKIVKTMGINGWIRRRDSMMIEANIRFLSQMELIYSCITKECVYLAKERLELLAEDLKPYADPNDFNRIFYHRRNEAVKDKIQKLLN